MASLSALGIGKKRTFIIAEGGINHNGTMKTALRMIDAAKKAGADAIKFQTYITEKRVAKGSPIYGILKQCELTANDMARLKKHADTVGIIFFSTPFDTESVLLLKKLRVRLIKISSFDIVNEPLLKTAASTGIPLIISRGMATKKEINRAVSICERMRAQFALLHCVSAYPTPKAKVNLCAISTLRRLYPKVVIGYSDHTLDLDACVYAVALGARILEKHFTLDRNMKGPDHALSADPKMLAELVSRVRELEVMLGSGSITSLPIEKATRQYRRVTR